MICQKQIRRKKYDDRIHKDLRQRPHYAAACGSCNLLNKIADISTHILQLGNDRRLRICRKILQKSPDPLAGQINFLPDRRINFWQCLPKLRHFPEHPGKQRIDAKDHQGQHTCDQNHRAVPADDLQPLFKKSHQRICDRCHDPSDHKRKKKHHQPQSPDTDQINCEQRNQNI